MNIQTKRRTDKLKGFIEKGKTLEIGIEDHRITNGMSLDYNKDFNPTILHNLNEGKIPVKDNSFDVVTAGEVLEHLINPYKTAREVYRILKPNGIFVLSVPNISSLVNRIKGLFGRLPSGCCLPVDRDCLGRHINDYNFREITKVLKQANFKIENKTSNGLIIKSKLITKFIPASMGETLIIKARKRR